MRNRNMRCNNLWMIFIFSIMNMKLINKNLNIKLNGMKNSKT